MRKAMIGVFAIGLTFGAAQYASAQDPAAPPQQPQEHQQVPEQAPAEQQETARQTAQGELARVDSETKMLTIKSADGTEMEFSYNDETEVTGAQEGVAGLATAAGSQVVVEFEQEGESKIAKKIEVKASQQY